MKNKDRYDLTKIDCGVSWQINGCGRRIEESRTITICIDEEERSVVLHKKKTQESLINYLLKWLESDIN